MCPHTSTLEVAGCVLVCAFVYRYVCAPTSMYAGRTVYRHALVLCGSTCFSSMCVHPPLCTRIVQSKASNAAHTYACSGVCSPHISKCSWVFNIYFVQSKAPKAAHTYACSGSCMCALTTYICSICGERIYFLYMCGRYIYTTHALCVRSQHIYAKRSWCVRYILRAV